MVKENKVATGVRVKLNSNFEINRFEDLFIIHSRELTISDDFIGTTDNGKCVFVKGIDESYINLKFLNLDRCKKHNLNYKIDYNNNILLCKNNLPEKYTIIFEFEKERIIPSQINNSYKSEIDLTNNFPFGMPKINIIHIYRPNLSVNLLSKSEEEFSKNLECSKIVIHNGKESKEFQINL